MLVVTKIIDVIINPVIWVGAIVVLVAMILISKKLKGLKAEISNAIYGSKGTAFINPKTLALKQRDTAVSKREDIYPLRKEFNETCSAYLTWAQAIPIFPLLGILGTVAGLILQVSTQDAGAIYAALNTALSSTLWGLIAAIVLKVIEAWLVLGNINAIETYFSDYDMKYKDAMDMRELDKEYEK